MYMKYISIIVSLTLRAINPVKYLRNFIEQQVRSDGRELLEFRPTIINKDSISKAEGSALVKIGSTTVICGIKAVRGTICLNVKVFIIFAVLGIG